MHTYISIHVFTYLPILLGDTAQEAEIQKCNVPLRLPVLGRKEEDVALWVCSCVFFGEGVGDWLF